MAVIRAAVTVAVAVAVDLDARASLATAEPTSLTPAQFVDALYANAGVASPPSISGSGGGRDASSSW